MPRAGGPVVRRWRVTVNHSNEEHEDVVHQTHERIMNIDLAEYNIRLMVWQKERGRETARLHIQAYLEFSRAVRDTHVNRVFDRVVDSRTCDASREANIEYVSKPETREEGPFRRGEETRQGKRNDLQAVQEMVRAGASPVELWEEHFPTMVKYAAAIERYRVVRALERVAEYRPLTVNVYWGETGLGKSRRARHEAELVGGGLYSVDVPDKAGASKWFDFYGGQRSILIDDYNGEFAINWFKRFLDGYPMILPIKGAFTLREVTHVFITSNHNPDDWYPDVSQVDRDALRRRYTYVCRFFTEWVPEEPDLTCHEEPLSPEL